MTKLLPSSQTTWGMPVAKEFIPLYILDIFSFWVSLFKVWSILLMIPVSISDNLPGGLHFHPLCFDESELRMWLFQTPFIISRERWSQSNAYSFTLITELWRCLYLSLGYDHEAVSQKYKEFSLEYGSTSTILCTYWLLDCDFFFFTCIIINSSHVSWTKLLHKDFFWSKCTQLLIMYWSLKKREREKKRDLFSAFLADKGKVVCKKQFYIFKFFFCDVLLDSKFKK